MWIKQLSGSSGLPSEAMQASDRQAVNGLIRVGVAFGRPRGGVLCSNVCCMSFAPPPHVRLSYRL
jgi:hypothetical protein